MELEATDQQSGKTGNLAITNDMWMAPEIPGYDEVREFNKRFAVKMGVVFGDTVQADGGCDATRFDRRYGGNGERDVKTERHPCDASDAHGIDHERSTSPRRLRSALACIEWAQRGRCRQAECKLGNYQQARWIRRLRQEERPAGTGPIEVKSGC